ncbi:MAG: hypothetical protein ACYSO3_01590 [Planctomycetota bacterium]|jgi:hypothetical protein
MIRKSKRQSLNEAIRQGQARIAEGLKTGQMRSDGPSVQKPEPRKRELFSTESPRRGSFFLKSKKSSGSSSSLAQKAKLKLLLVLALLIAGIWIVAALLNPEPSDTPDAAVSPGSETDPAAAEEGISEQVPEQKVIETAGGVSLPVAGGDNVILIESIALDRRDELVPLKTFFNVKGIETEIIEVGDSGRAALVTQEGFDKNPASAGTEGYALMQRIKRLGAVYVRETEDTKFGQNPFQGSYGYKRK